MASIIEPQVQETPPSAEDTNVSNSRSSNSSVKEQMAWLSSEAFKDKQQNALPDEESVTSPKRSSCKNNGSLIANRMKWLEKENQKEAVVSTVKDQNIVGGSGVISERMKWLDKKNNEEAVVSTVKDQNIEGGVGVISDRMKWLEMKNQEGPMTSSFKKDRVVGGSGVVARQQQWVKEQSEKQFEKAQVSIEKKDKDDNNIKSGTSVADRLKRVEEEKQRFKAVEEIHINDKQQRQEKEVSPTSVRDIISTDSSSKIPLPDDCLTRATTTTAAASPPTSSNSSSSDGCYLTYENDSGGRLMLHYKRGNESPPDNAVGYYTPGVGKKIQGFKFKQAGGRSELIKGIAGGDSNRRKYFVGWCLFIKQAKAMNGHVQKFHAQQGVDVDIYGYKSSDCQPSLLFKSENNNEFVEEEISCYDAVAVMPRHKTFLQGVKTVVVSTFLEKGNLAGSSTTLQ